MKPKKKPSSSPETFDFFIIGAVTLPEFNRGFHQVASCLRGQGFTVASPVEHQPELLQEFVPLLRHAIPLLAASRKVVLCASWKNCPLAVLLVYLAQRLELPFYNFADMAEIPGMQLHLTYREAAGGDPRRARELLRQLQDEEDAR